MRFILLFLLLFQPVSKAGVADPFVNPIREMESKALNLKASEGSREVKLFKPALPKPLWEMRVEGVIGVKGEYVLVVQDPENGEAYYLKEGEAVSPSAKVVRILPDRVLIAHFSYRGRRLVKSIKTLRVGPEERKNGD